MNSDQFAAKIREQLAAPGTTPLEHLRHTVAAFHKQPDDEMPIMATMGVYPERTGLTWGDLRALLAMIDSKI